MGGKLFNCERMDLETFNDVSNIAMNALKNATSSGRSFLLRGYTQKQSFGDVDILVEATNWNFFNLFVKFLKDYGSVEWRKTHDRLRSVLFQGKYQIDVLIVEEEHIINVRDTMQYGDFMVFVGELLHSVGCRFAPTSGLGFKYNDFADFKIKEHFNRYYYIPGTTLFNAMEMLGISIPNYINGITSEEEVFELFISSPFFYDGLLDDNERNNASTKRMEERGVVGRFKEWYAAKQFKPRAKLEDRKERIIDYVNAVPLRRRAELVESMNSDLKKMLVDSETKPIIRKARVELTHAAIGVVFGLQDNYEIAMKIRSLYADGTLQDSMTIEELLSNIYMLKYKD